MLLDRDGVLNRDVGSPGVVRAEQFSLLPGVADAVRALKEDGHACMVVTNQNARRKKAYCRQRRSQAVHASLRKEVPVDDIFVATGLDGPALKPSPDLVNLALGDADRERAVLVGDSRTDMIAACRAGILAVLVTSSHHGVACAAELAEAPTPAVIAGGAPGGLLRDGASVAAAFPGPAAGSRRSGARLLEHGVCFSGCSAPTVAFGAFVQIRAERGDRSAAARRPILPSKRERRSPRLVPFC